VLAVCILTVVVGSVLELVPARAQSEDQNWALCSAKNADSAIKGCTAVIQSGQETDENLAIAFSNRGIGYDEKGQYDLAIAD